MRKMPRIVWQMNEINWSKNIPKYEAKSYKSKHELNN